jgi:4-hydroxy-tetrahydrodipicolinate synthase
LDRLRGTFTALVTPFGAEGGLDLDGLRQLVRRQIEGGVNGFVALGTTGETPTLERDERDQVIQSVVKENAGALPIIVGTGSYSTKGTIEETKRAKDLGADAALVVVPYYSKPTNEGLYRHFKAVAEEGGLPVVIYNIASRTAKNLETSVLERLAALPGIVGVKESSADIGQMMDVVQRIGRKRADFSVLSGDDAFAFPLMALGGDGVVSVAANAVPRRMAELTEAALEGEMETARIRHYGLLPFFRALFLETNPVPIKAAMAALGMAAGPVRLPLCELEAANLEALARAMAAAGVK